MEELRVEETDDSKRLDVVLASHDKVSSRSEAQRIIKSGNVSINETDLKITPKRIVKKGDLIRFTLIPPEDTTIIPVEKKLNIVFEDQHLLVVNKPRGMVVHPSAGHYNDTLVNYLLHHTSLSDFDDSRPGIVHRIDKDTSGLLVVAKNNKIHEDLSKQFFYHSINRLYYAIVWGTPKVISGTVDKPIGRHPSDRKKFSIRESGKNAVTHWKLLESYKYLSLIECQLETGRTHQIRVHMNSISHPLLGDAIYGRFRNYGNKISPDLFKKLKEFEGQALHAKMLGFEHPESKKWLEFDSGLPLEMETLLNVLRETT